MQHRRVYSGFQLSALKSKPKLSPCQSQTTHNPINQSKLETVIRSRRKARKNACEIVTIGLSFISGWMRNFEEKTCHMT